jgi:methionine-rich copper-binding protein CopC
VIGLVGRVGPEQVGADRHDEKRLLRPALGDLLETERGNLGRRPFPRRWPRRTAAKGVSNRAPTDRIGVSETDTSPPTTEGSMKVRHTRWFVLLSAVSLTLTPGGLEARDHARLGDFAPANAEAPEVVVRHITLDATSPAAGQVVSGQVTEIRLFFSGAPLLRGASVRIVTSQRSLMRSSPPAADANDPRQLFVTIDQPLPSGSYVIQWRCIADDGHVMRGDFRFEVAAR